MIKKISLLIGILIITFSCNKDELKSIVPAYIHIDEMRVNTDFSTEGTESEKITTVWVYVGDSDIPLGAYELPADFPVIASGNTKIRIEAGMNLNGAQSLRTPYPFYSIYEETINLTPEKTHYLNAQQDSLPFCSYTSFLELKNVENFESAGIGLEPSPNSDTILVKINKNEGAFVFKNEPTTSGKAVIKPNGFFEVVSIAKYDFIVKPNYYVELDYKCDIPFTVGVYMNTPAQTIQAPVVTVNPTSTWNKIYINLITELGATVPDDFQIFIGAINNTSATKEIYIDNLKLVY